MTTTHVISLHLGSAAQASQVGASGAGSSRDVALGADGPRIGEATTLEWFESLARIATLEESSAELVLHLRDGGMRFVPVAAGDEERRECFNIVSDALRMLQAS